MPIVLDAKAGESRTTFSVVATRPSGEPGTTSFAASRIERRPNMRIFRFAFADAKEQAFVFDDALTGATVAPPQPFSGSASFLSGAGGGPSWTGPLSVDLPGAEGVALAGEDFAARLYRLGRDGIAKVGSGA
jgi:hypothetical protein